MYERLLVPIEGGALDERAFAASIELATKLVARIVGFIAEPYSTGRSVGGLPRRVANSDATAQAHSQRVLERFAQLARDGGVPFEGVATQASHVGEAILGAAQEHGCDTIVMVTQGRGDLSALVHGSNTRYVMAHTTLPVLVLH